MALPDGEPVTADMTDPRMWVRIVSDLRWKLNSGAIAAGESVSIAQLSGQWGTSREPVAKALRTLEADGLVRRYPGVGYYVLSPQVGPRPAREGTRRNVAAGDGSRPYPYLEE